MRNTERMTRPPNRKTCDRHPVDAQRDRLTRGHLALAYRLAAKYRGKGIPLDDLRQVAALALVKAATSYSADRGSTFASYAIPTINGELRKHFRDHGWWVRPPRPLQELHARTRSVEEALQHELRRAPSVAEISVALEAEPADVRAARDLGSHFAPSSIDVPVDADSPTLAQSLTLDHDVADGADLRVTLEAALAHLSTRDREIVHLRFVRELTQAEIGDALGVTQMQVSRLLTRILATLREILAQAQGTEPTREAAPSVGPLRHAYH